MHRLAAAMLGPSSHARCGPLGGFVRYLRRESGARSCANPGKVGGAGGIEGFEDKADRAA